MICTRKKSGVVERGAGEKRVSWPGSQETRARGEGGRPTLSEVGCRRQVSDSHGICSSRADNDQPHLVSVFVQRTIDDRWRGERRGERQPASLSPLSSESTGTSPVARQRRSAGTSPVARYALLRNAPSATES